MFVKYDLQVKILENQYKKYTAENYTVSKIIKVVDFISDYVTRNRLWTLNQKIYSFQAVNLN